jgi:trimeric autotransporter adhesin
MLISRLIKRHIAGIMKKLFLFSVFYLLFSTAHAQIITTIAGNGTTGFNGDDGPATNASFRGICGVAIDNMNNLYIADANNNRIRKVTQEGIITTIAGTGTASYGGDGGPATAAKLNYPTDIAIDRYGNIFIADGANNCVRKINILGVISTIAGDGHGGYNGDGMSATLAELYFPFGVAVDNAGNIYIAEAANNRVRKINTSGIISTIAGNGIQGYSGDNISATLAELNYPVGVQVNEEGHIIIADSGNDRIREIDTAGIIKTIAGTGMAGFNGDGIPATDAQLKRPVYLAVDSSANIYITDQFNHRIRKVNASGIITTISGIGVAGFNGDNILAATAEINTPVGIAIDGNNNLCFSDNGNERVRLIRSTVFINPLLQPIEAISTYPNPNNGSFSIKISSAYTEMLQATIINIIGEKVKEINGITNKPIEVQLNVPAGAYFITAIVNDEKYTGKVVIIQ